MDAYIALTTGQLATDAEIIGESATVPERFGEIYDRHATEIHRYLARRMGTAVADRS
ncbi:MULTISPECIES: hypothetical protein [Kitasatospora]|uniref:hypothetical protein n=1 Tax=Kitasatospora TaxID=2063 RepID=UPI0015D59D6D|nr:hypothetical protein [Kitasatospora sp. GP30]